MKGSIMKLHPECESAHVLIEFGPGLGESILRFRSLLDEFSDSSAGLDKRLHPTQVPRSDVATVGRIPGGGVCYIRR